MSTEISGITLPLLFSDTHTETVEGYCWPLSASPGETINFFISAAYNYNLEYVRLTDLDDDGSGTPLISLGEQTSRVQPISDKAWRDGCSWRVTSQLTVPANWRSGLYAARLTSAEATKFLPAFIVFIVKPRDQLSGDYLLIAHTLTWNAYNTWGGYSRYTDPGNVYWLSFLRPIPNSSPIYGSSADAPNHWLQSELWVLKWMLEEGHNVDVITDQDFHFGIPMQDQYASIILNTHPEYWTQAMFDWLKDYLNVGGCLIYLGGNGLFERVQLDLGGSTLVFHGGSTKAGSDRNEQFFRNLKPPQPERDILGVGFLFDGYESKNSGYAVLLPEHRFFNGIELEFMSIIGEMGINGGASGKEMDSSRAGDAKPGDTVNAWIHVPPNSQHPDGEYGTDRGHPPPNLQVLARGNNKQVQGQGEHAAEMTYYDTNAGGFVFSVGSMTFTGSLALDTNLQKTVNNALHESLLVRLNRTTIPPGLPSVVPSVLLLI